MTTIGNALMLASALSLGLACGSPKEGQTAANVSVVYPSSHRYVEHQTLETGSISQFTATANFKFSSSSEWMNHYNAHRGYGQSYGTAPYVDFNSSAIVAIHLGQRPNAGHRVNIVSVSDDYTDNTIQIRYEVVVDNSMYWQNGVHFPYAFVSVTPRDREFRFIRLTTRYQQ